MVGLDVSAGMLAEAAAVCTRVRASARRLPFGRASFDGVLAVEVFEHLAPEAIDRVCGEVLAGARAGGNVRGHRQERLLVECPSSLAAERGGEVDRRAPGSLDVFAPRSGARALVPAAGAQASAGPMVSRGAGLASALAWRNGPVSVSVGAGCAAPGALGGDGAGRSAVTELYSHRLASLPLLLWKTPPGLELILAQEGVPFETVKDPHPLSFRAGRFVLFDGQTARPRARSGRSRAYARLDRRRRLPARRDDRSICGPGRSPRGAWLVDVRRIHGFRAGGPVCKGLVSPAADRPAARRGDRARAASGCEFLRFPTRIDRRSASGQTSMNRCPRTTIASRRRGQSLGPCSTHFVSTYAYTHHQSVLERSETARHPVARAFPSRVPRAGIESGESRASSPDPVQLGDRAGRIRRAARSMAREPGRTARGPRLSLFIRLSDRLRRFPVLSLEGRPILAGAADPGSPGLRGAVPGCRRRSTRN